jgi:lycopene cyclase domain-containing protein
MPDQPGEYEYRDGKKGLYWVWWVAGSLVGVLAALPFLRKKIHGRALLVASVLFILSMFVSETLAIYQGWWIWNDQKLLGPKVGLIPLEEFALYFVCVPSVVVIQLFFQKLWESILKKEHPHDRVDGGVAR